MEIRDFTQSEIDALQEVEGILVTKDEAYKGHLIGNATNAEFMIEGPGGVDAVDTIEELVAFFKLLD